MKKALAVILAVTSFNTLAYYEDPHQSFNMTSNDTDKVEITFVQAKNVTQACEAESRARGKGGFGQTVDACSFWNWNKTQCTIITGTKANFHTIGHEVRHCLQGNFHK